MGEVELSRLPRDDQPRRVRAKEGQESEGGEEPDSGEVERHYDVNNVPALAGELDEGRRPQHHHRSAKVPRVCEGPAALRPRVAERDCAASLAKAVRILPDPAGDAVDLWGTADGHRHRV